MDFGSSPRNKPKNTFQEELAAKMKDRRSRGLAADITPSPSVHDDSDDDGLGSDDELLTQFGLTSKKTSANSKSEVTTPGRGASPWKPPTSGNKNSNSPTTDRRKKSNAEDIIFGKKSPNSFSERNDVKGRQSPFDRKNNDEHMFGRKTPTNDRNDKGRESPFDMFGRKTPTNEDKYSTGMKNAKNSRSKSPFTLQDEGPGKQMWTPPSLRKATPADDNKESKGRRTPGGDESGHEQPHPVPRRRTKHSEDNSESDDSPRAKPQTTPRHLPRGQKSVDKEDVKTKPKQRKTPSVDIFGSARKSPAVEIDSDEEVKQTNRHRKSPAPGRKTPVSWSNTPKTEVDARKNGKSPVQRRASIMDFVEDDAVIKPKPRSRKPVSRQDSDSDDESRQKGDKSRRSPFGDRSRKSPFGDRSYQNRGDGRSKYDDEEEDVRQSSKSPFGGRHNDDENERPRPRTRKIHKDDERESSICRDVVKDPTLVVKEQEVQEVVKIKRKPQTQEHTELDDLIDRIAIAQEDEDPVANTMRYIQPDKTTEKSQKRPASSTPKRKPVPRYTERSFSPNSSSGSQSYESTDCIRQAVYEEWYKEKLERIKKEKILKAKKEKEQEEAKRKEENDKKLEAEATYRSWLGSKKDSVDVDYLKKRKKAEKDEKAKQEEEIEKKKEAELTYRSWKENKDAKIRETLRKTKKEEMESTKKKDEEKLTKKKDAAKIYEGWKNKKDEKLKDKAKEERKKKMEETKLQEKESKTREREADELYEAWIERKEKQQKDEKKERRRKKGLEAENPQPAWSPSNKTIPYRR